MRLRKAVALGTVTARRRAAAGRAERTVAATVLVLALLSLGSVQKRVTAGSVNSFGEGSYAPLVTVTMQKILDWSLARVRRPRRGRRDPRTAFEQI
ncbi:MAG TPA: hypothetical protein VJ866_24470 [Pyrinomonadaceae bacterium]|nr:hypothetical protein [Pyrinomonadaceae bacterium]